MLRKSRTALSSQWLVVPDVRKVGSLKRWVRRWMFSTEMKNGTRLWREEHLQVKMRKTPHDRSNFWSSDFQKWHAAVARSTFASQNEQNTTWSYVLDKWHAAVARSTFGRKNVKTLHARATLWSLDVQNRTPLWREAHFHAKMYKTPAFWHAFGPSDVEKASHRRDR